MIVLVTGGSSDLGLPVADVVFEVASDSAAPIV
jgi:hypothetical protein